jgi:hypothetical protein
MLVTGIVFKPKYFSQRWLWPNATQSGTECKSRATRLSGCHNKLIFQYCCRLCVSRGINCNWVHTVFLDQTSILRVYIFENNNSSARSSLSPTDLRKSQGICTIFRMSNNEKIVTRFKKLNAVPAGSIVRAILAITVLLLSVAEREYLTLARI